MSGVNGDGGGGATKAPFWPLVDSVPFETTVGGEVSVLGLVLLSRGTATPLMLRAEVRPQAMASGRPEIVTL